MVRLNKKKQNIICYILFVLGKKRHSPIHNISDDSDTGLNFKCCLIRCFIDLNMLPESVSSIEELDVDALKESK